MAQRPRRPATSAVAILVAGLALFLPPPADAQRYDPRGSDPLVGQGDPHRERVEVRLNALENEIRAVTGRVEDLTFNVRRLQDRLDKLVADVDFRLTNIERALREGGTPAPGAAAAASPALPTVPPASASAPAAPPPAAAASSPPTGGQAQRASVALPAGSAMDQYAFAQQLMSQTRYAEAESAFRQFVERHPEGQLADNARYWLAETHYVRRQFPDAASGFLEAYQTAPAGNKAPDNLLKLGMSLAALQKNQEACVALDKLLREYGDADARIRQRAEQERGQLACG
ncbi:MAG: tol-pal system protein YbgF [Alphaproteobacteria bacterium]